MKINEIHESIHQMNPEEPMNPEVLIQGYGRLNLKQLDKDALIVTMGNFYEHPQIREIGPNIHVFAASHPPITKKVLTNWWMRCNDILPKKTILLIEKRDREVAKKVFSDRKLFFYSYGGRLPVDFTKKILSPHSVSIIALQLAIYVGLKEIFLSPTENSKPLKSLLKTDSVLFKKYSYFFLFCSATLLESSTDFL